MYVTTVLGLVVCTARVITGTGEGLPPHCFQPSHPLPCEKCEEKMWYGENCTKACSSGCNDYGCNKTTGECKSCEAGYHSFYCTLECPPNCLNDSHGPAKCDQNTANCTNCQPTWWGSHCTNKCDSNCKDGVCDFDDGHCNECVVGKAGENCSEDCSTGCWLHECDRENMICTGGCTPGYFGETCEKKCNDNCVCREQCPECPQNNVTCSSSNSNSKFTGVNASAIAGSLTGICVIVVAVAVVGCLVCKKTRRFNRLFWRCRSRQPSEAANNDVLETLAQDEDTGGND
ncbi:multiple epidermal growth factor-like domains protein 10 isoform X2 [Haliotis rufescens]|uniref:multiple epidermal growth factor-like domains protein 10 isoform X2 n=1 Tax=Haliotis rufescens TaxID=6454 RepID=UPI00201EB486|nr:multiple epidermal growth factor-like domains protein 10 isoform X2 [Haliotis rufescens]XP_046365924.2 multiple epidermal growth factor-like domains protein 10 isoform X2 [Haliotis rufescens]